MRTLLFLSVCTAIIISSCTTTSKVNFTKTYTKTLGSDFAMQNVMQYDELLKKLETSAEIDGVVVEGMVEGVCQAKGCWMNIASDKKPDADKMFVKFHNYGFFMPLDLAGNKVVMKGKAFIEESSVDELRHYAEDAGKSAEEIAKITEPSRELKFIATGVKLKPETK